VRFPQIRSSLPGLGFGGGARHGRAFNNYSKGFFSEFRAYFLMAGALLL
jgi:hypothetical protein